MPYYNLFVEKTGETHSEKAATREEALAKFGKSLSLRLTLEGPDISPPYMLGEREENCSWIGKPTIKVFDVSDTNSE